VEVIRTDAAVTAPVESVEPLAVTQSPTARFEAAADSISVKVVDELTAMVMLVLGAVVVVEPPPKRTDAAVPVITSALVETASTLPVAKLVGVPARGAGRVPPGVVVPVPRPPPPKPPPCGRLAVHVPDADGGATLTVRAVIVPLEVVPVTTTHSPAATEEAVSVALRLKVVDWVQLTVTCPVCWFWTSIEDADSEATDPVVPGNAPPLDAGADPDPGATVVVDDAAVVPPPPQAARVAASANPAASVAIPPR
jgi:hypothetical protein